MEAPDSALETEERICLETQEGSPAYVPSRNEVEYALSLILKVLGVVNALLAVYSLLRKVWRLP